MNFQVILRFVHGANQKYSAGNIKEIHFTQLILMTLNSWRKFNFLSVGVR